jgi:hypothetical protein
MFRRYFARNITILNNVNKPRYLQVFFLLLLLILIGEALGSPALTLADSAVLTYLGEDAEHYGFQRMFGSIGWGIAMFFIGMALDHSTNFPDHPCRVQRKERNYTICFAVFSVLMGCAGLTATQFMFNYNQPPQNINMSNLNNENPEDGAKEPLQKEYKFALEGNPVPEPVDEPIKPKGNLGKVQSIFIQQCDRLNIQ